MTQALLLMDIQYGVLERVGAGDAYLDQVVAVQERAERANLLVVVVRVAFGVGYPEVSARNKSFSALAKGPGMVVGTPAVEPHARLLRGNGEVVVTKKRISAFAGSDLELVLRSHDVTHLVLAGISTSGVVLSTVREAADRDYELTVLEDLCLDADEEVHRVLTTKLFPRQADVKASNDWRP
ncbi:MAG TPA: isochorismatase family cysteine hydrolase [Acidothermaceae bacterium]|jgi:nicotinamidase-related amidase|nr:isochorismatase family cysteine hydrolase [Acidothermaceae bacterium]